MNDSQPQDELDDRQSILNQLVEHHPLYSKSICSKCKNLRVIQSGKGSLFLLCQSSAISQGWPKYPPQPLSRCPHFNMSEASSA
jgi:hypothetical protein